jgi:hypothetical protein
VEYDYTEKMSLMHWPGKARLLLPTSCVLIALSCASTKTTQDPESGWMPGLPDSGDVAWDVQIVLADSSVVEGLFLGFRGDTLLALTGTVDTLRIPSATMREAKHKRSTPLLPDDFSLGCDDEYQEPAGVPVP